MEKTLRILLDLSTGNYEATVLGFHAWIIPAPDHPGWYFVHPTIGDKMRELLRERSPLGTLDEVRAAIESELAKLASID